MPKQGGCHGDLDGRLTAPTGPGSEAQPVFHAAFFVPEFSPSAIQASSAGGSARRPVFSDWTKSAPTWLLEI